MFHKTDTKTCMFVGNPINSLKLECIVGSLTQTAVFRAVILASTSPVLFVNLLQIWGELKNSF